MSLDLAKINFKFSKENDLRPRGKMIYLYANLHLFVIVCVQFLAALPGIHALHYSTSALSKIFMTKSCH